MTTIIQKKPKLTVWVNSANNEEEYRLFKEIGVGPAVSYEKADVMLFVGGADVNPLLYGEEPIRGTRFSEFTDRRDLLAWRIAQEKIKVGICRGGQFLNVMNAGRLWQDVDGHTGSHILTDTASGKTYRVSSTHHQQFRPGVGSVTLATARMSTRKSSETQTWKMPAYGETFNKWDTYFTIDHEVLWYPRTLSLCFQPHPEYMEPAQTARYFDEIFWRCAQGKAK